MRTINLVKKLDDELLMRCSSYAKMEISEAIFQRNFVESNSTHIWQLFVDKTFVGYAGVASQSFFSPLIFWLIPVDLHSISVMKAYKFFSQLLHANFKNIITLVQSDWKPGERFAGYCGFTSTSNVVQAYNRNYTVYTGRN